MEKLKLGCTMEWDLALIMMLQAFGAQLWRIAQMDLGHFLVEQEGDSHLVEWNEIEGAIKRTYIGFKKYSLGVVQFETTRNHFLAAGDEIQIKFWDMDNSNILTTIDADGGLPASPRLGFDREDSLLSVTTSDNGMKILANADGQRLIRMLESRAFEGSRNPAEPINRKTSVVTQLASMASVSAPLAASIERSDITTLAVSVTGLAPIEIRRTLDVKPRVGEDVHKVKIWKLSNIAKSNELQVLRLPDPLVTGKVLRLLYTNSGYGIFIYFHSQALEMAKDRPKSLWKVHSICGSPAMAT